MGKRFRYRKGWWRLALPGLGAVIALLIVPFFSGMAADASSASNLARLDEQIKSLRMGDLVVRVVDESGTSVPGVPVHVAQTRHDFKFGGSLRTDMFQEGFQEGDRTAYLNTAQRLFNATVPEDALKWYSTESSQGEVSYADADQILAWSEQHHMPMRGHHLFWAVDQWNQPWLKTLSPETLRTAVQQRAIEVCRRYQGRITEYDVLNEILNGDFFQRQLGAGIIAEMFQWCQTSDPTAQLYTNEYNILNEEQLEQYKQLLQSLLDQNIPVGGIGVQAHLRQTIAPEQMQRALDALAVFGLPIKVTEVSVVADTEAAQAQQLADLYRVAFAHPAVHGITLWGFWEGSNWEPRSALFRQNWEPKPAALTYDDLIFRDWWTDEVGTTNDQGEYTAHAFYGDYEITLAEQTHPVVSTISMGADDRHAEVTLTLK
jgi:GH35 family endo-1,4-beta-xylanase